MGVSEIKCIIFKESNDNPYEIHVHFDIVGSGLRNLAKTCSRRLLGPILHNVNQMLITFYTMLII
jgi:hypothetical protein